MDAQVAIREAEETQRRLGGVAGAEKLFGNLHPYRWGISKEQLKAFGGAVRAGMAGGEITNPHGNDPSHPFHYPQAKFDDPNIGPNMHQVNAGFIKPHTLDHPRLPGASYAVLQNLDEGLPCSLFISHAWDEGVFEFIEHALREWPDECEGAYICFLSNPQNLDISGLLNHPDGSPFERVLKMKPKMVLLLANVNTPIHTRLCAPPFNSPVLASRLPLSHLATCAHACCCPRAGCVLEVFLAKQLGLLVRLAGDPLHLITGDQFEKLHYRVAQQGVGEHQLVVEQQLGGGPPARGSLREFLEQLKENASLKASSAQLKGDLVMLQDTIGALGDRGADWLGQLRVLPSV